PSEEGARPAGHFDGTLALARVESLGAVVSPAAFAGAAEPVSGNVRFDVLADLADGRLRARLKTSLADLGIDAADWFAKPAGRPASLTLDALWQSGAQDHVEASAEVELPGVRLRALGRSEVQVRFVDLAGSAPEADAAPAAPPPEAAPADGDAPADADAAPAAPKWGAIHVQLVPTSTLELRAAVSDLASAAEVSPALARNLRRWGAAGAADATVLLSMGRRAIEATANVDLTAAAIDFSPYLRKPAGRVLRIDLAADAPPPTGQSLRLHLAKVEARLGDSVARAEDGWARLSVRGLTSGLSGTALLTAVLEEADVRVRADVNHDAALGAALPWLEPLYTRCRLDGPTKLTVAYSGTPLRGRVQLDADATACRISPGQPAGAGAETGTGVAPGAAATGGAAGPGSETVIKAAGIPATVRLELRYGEVPGEMVIDRLSTTLADATAETQGRMLFDDPRLTVLAPPTAWSFEVHGRMPDAAVLASLLPARLADLKPTGGVTLELVAAADAKATQLESCRLRFDKAGITWLGKPIQLDGPVTYDHHRLATEGLRVVAGGSDVNVVAYVADPKRDPTGSVFITGPRFDLKEALALVQETSAYVASLTSGAGGKPGATGRALSEMVALRARQLLAGARLSVEVNLDRVTLAVPQWNTTYDLLGLKAEARLA
ncbi:MAG: hypothetical protein IMZ66_06170, partial [Planctomycetes bacterium]|nr:hypothetical protein [Planctomycetota bacterium]